MKNVLISLLILTIFSCKSENDIFPIDSSQITLIKTVPILDKSIYPFDVINEFTERDQIQKIVSLVNKKTKYREYISKLNQNKFFLVLNYHSGETLKIPLGFNKKYNTTRTRLYSRGNGGYLIGNYEMNGLYEYLTAIVK